MSREVKAAADGLARSMSSRDMMMKAGKEIAKSVVIAKAAQVGARRTGLAAAASAVGAVGWAGGLVAARKISDSYLDPVSANQINRDPEYCMNVHLLFLSKDPANMDELRKTYEFYCRHFKRFRQRVVVRDFMWPYWEEVERMDLNQHIFSDATECTRTSLVDLVSNSLTQGLNPLIPLWRVTMYNNFAFDDGSRGSAMILKIHHCIGDGYSLAKTLMTAQEPTEEIPIPEVKPMVMPKAEKGEPGIVSKFVQSTVKLVVMQDDPPSSLKASKLLRGLDKRIAHWSIARTPVDDIKRACKARGYTINDIVFASLSAALRNYQILKGQTLIDPNSVMWVSMRPLSEAFGSRTPDAGNIGEPGNNTLGAVYVRLPVAAAYDTRAERAQAVSDQIAQLKGSPEAALSKGLVGMFGMLPKWLSNPIWHALSNKVSISVSNIPGPSEKIVWCGMRPESFSVWVPPVGTISTFALITSFAGRINLSLAMDGTHFTEEDVAVIGVEFDKELELLTTEMLPSRL